MKYDHKTVIIFIKWNIWRI